MAEMAHLFPPPQKAILSILLAFVVSAGIASARIFTDARGRTVEADLVRLEGASAVLRLADGKTFSVPLAQLSPADQQFLRSATPAPAAPGGEPLLWDHDGKPRNVPGLGIAQFRAWLPDAARPVRGMLVLVPGSNADGRGDAAAGDWQALARELDFGLIACFFKDAAGEGAGYCAAGNGSGKVLLEALDALAKEHRHPEIARAPLLLWGHSAGGQFNYNFACWKPERTLAFIVNKGGFYYDTPCRPPTRAVPAILFAGEKDTPERVRNITGLFEENRSKGALWALCVEKGLGHDVGRSRKIAQQFFRAVAPARLPATLDAPLKRLTLGDGLLALPGQPAVPPPQFKGNARLASWLPNAELAAAWQQAQ